MNHLTIFFVTDELFYCVRKLNTVYIYKEIYKKKIYVYIKKKKILLIHVQRFDCLRVH